MKIAVVSDGIWPEKIGGIQKHSYEFVLSLAKIGVEVGVFYKSDNQEFLNLVIQKKLSNVYLFPTPISTLPSFLPGHYLFTLFLSSRKIKQELMNSSFQPDFIFIQGLIAWSFKNIPFKTISHLHGLEMFQKSYSLKEKISKKAFQLISKSIIKHTNFQCFYGSYTASLLKELGAKKLILFPNAVRVNHETFPLASTRNFTQKKQLLSFVYLGRYEFRKGIRLLTQVLRELTENFQFEFHFIGDIPGKAQLTHPQIFYHGIVKEEQKIRLILRKADVLVLPSFAEGMPTSILEAMIEKKAIITTNVGENPWLVNESNGWVIQPNQKSSLKRAIEEALKCDLNTLQKKGEKSYQMVCNKYSWDTVVDNFLKQLPRER